MVHLDLMESAWSSAERVKVNENWKRIMRGFSKVNDSLRVLAGGKEVQEILQLIETTIINAQNATTDAQTAANQIATALNQLTVLINNTNASANAADTAARNANDATSAANTATSNARAAIQEAINTTQLANQATQSANDATSAANTAKANADTATQLANQATQSANDATNAATSATQLALQSIQDMSDAIADLTATKDSFEHKGTYNNTTFYYKNNETYHFGQTFRARKDGIGNPPPLTATSNEHWQIVARRGEDAPMDSIRIWRGATPPSDKRMIWWKDLNMVIGQEVEIYRGAIPPQNKTALWLKPREVTQ